MSRPPHKPSGTACERFGAEVKARRELLQLSKPVLANRVGFSEGRLRQIEKGFQLVHGNRCHTAPLPVTVWRIARELNWDAKEAFAILGYPASDIPTDIKKTRSERLFELIQDLPADHRNVVSNLVVALSGNRYTDDLLAEAS